MMMMMRGKLGVGGGGERGGGGDIRRSVVPHLSTSEPYSERDVMLCARVPSRSEKMIRGGAPSDIMGEGEVRGGGHVQTRMKD